MNFSRSFLERLKNLDRDLFPVYDRKLCRLEVRAKREDGRVHLIAVLNRDGVRDPTLEYMMLRRLRMNRIGGPLFKSARDVLNYVHQQEEKHRKEIECKDEAIVHDSRPLFKKLYQMVRDGNIKLPDARQHKTYKKTYIRRLKNGHYTARN